MTRRVSDTPPHTMTWAKAAPILLIAAVFDLLRAFFNFFWLFGPALLAVGVGTAVEGAVSSVAGSAVGGALGAGAALVAGFFAGSFGVAAFALFGVVMAMAFGLLGWLAVLFGLLLFNTRIFSPGSLLTVLFGVCVSELPFISALPALTATTWRLYHAQIKRERSALQAWHAEQAALQMQREQEYVAYMTQLEQMRALEEAQDEEAFEEQTELEEIAAEEEAAVEERGVEENEEQEAP